MLEIDIAYNIEKEDYLIDENIIEYVENILKKMKKKNFNDKTLYFTSNNK